MSPPWRTWMGVAAVAVLAIALSAVVAGRRFGLYGIQGERGYLAPVFAPGGQSIFTIERDVSAFVMGFGQEFFTRPAKVRIVTDRFSLVEMRLADGRFTGLHHFPPTPLHGATMSAYHGAIFGVAHAHLRWRDTTHLEFEIAVTRHDAPLARTFVTRGVWNPAAGASVAGGSWIEGSTGMGGDEPEQVSGDLEVMAPPDTEGLGCAIVVLQTGKPAARAFGSRATACEQKYDKYSAAALAPLSRRAAIERSATIRRTYDELVARGRQNGRSDGQARLDADDEMSRLGLYPKAATIVAERGECAGAAPLFDIADEQFKVGLFSDIDQAISAPGREVKKSPGSYIVRRDYTTSQRINEYLAAGHSSFLVHARGGCWQLSIAR